MKKFTAWITLFLLGLLLHVSSACAAEHAEKGHGAAASASPQSAHTVQRDAKVKLHYLLYLPKDYDKKDTWPLMLFLHGAGERGDNLDQVKKHGPPKLIEQGKSFPFLVVSPQCPARSLWDPDTLTALLDEIVEKYKIDKDRIYLTGLSLGGFGTWSLAAHSPTRFAAIVPICGGGKPTSAKLLTHVPAWVFHGGKDPVVPLSQSEGMVKALKQAGGNVQFTVYPNAAHDAWTETYANPKLYEWLLQQKRAEEKPKAK